MLTDDCSGKSSFTLALLKAFKYSGQVVIDGVDLADVAPEVLRSRITVLPQEPVTLPGTVRDNLIPSFVRSEKSDAVATDEVVQGLLRDVGLYDRIESHGGLDAPFKDVGLSHGQKQLFALVRLILYNRIIGTKFIIMDEATSHLDYTTDLKAQELLIRELKASTVLNVTHRIVGFPTPDYTLEFDSGRLKSIDYLSEAAKAYTGEQASAEKITEKSAVYSEDENAGDNGEK